MIINHIQIQYKDHEVQEFDVEYSSGEFYIETCDVKITLDKFHFEELRTKMNELHDEVN